MRPALADVLDVLPIFRRRERTVNFVPQEIGKADDRVERRPQLVTHVGEEIGLAQARGLGFLGRRDQFGLNGLALRDVPPEADQQHVVFDRNAGKRQFRREYLPGHPATPHFVDVRNILRNGPFYELPLRLGELRRPLFEQDGDRLADDVRGSIAEYPLCRPVRCDDDLIAVQADDRLGSIVENGLELGLRIPRPQLRLAAQFVV